MALLYPVVVPCSVILSRIAGDGFTGPTIHSADLNDIGVARFFRCLLTPITAAAHAALSLSVKCFLSPFDMLEEIGKSGVPDVARPDICMPGLFETGDRRMRWPFVALLLVSGAGIAEAFAYGKKKNRSAE